MLNNNPCAKRILFCTELKIAPFPTEDSKPALVAVLKDEFGPVTGLVSYLDPDDSERNKPFYYR